MTFDEDAYDPWSPFDEDAADALRSVIGASLDEALAPLREHSVAQNRRNEELQLESDENLMRSRYGPAYDQNRVEILNYAVANGITDLDIAVRAFRPDAPMQSQSNAAAIEQWQSQWQARDARIEQLRHVDTDEARFELSNLRHQRDEAQDSLAKQSFEQANGTDARADTLKELGDLQARRKASNAANEKAGLRTERVGTEEGRLQQDARAIDLFRGGKPEKAYEPSRADRDADRNNISEFEQRLVDWMAADNKADRDRASNAEDTVQAIAHEDNAADRANQ
jgi:hypothetical protein